MSAATPRWPAAARATCPTGAEPAGTGWYEGVPVARVSDTGELLAYRGGYWQPVALILAADQRSLTVACPTCPPPRLRQRKAPRQPIETVATHHHGRPPGERGPVLDRAPHHRGPGYVILDPLGLLARSEPAQHTNPAASPRFN